MAFKIKPPFKVDNTPIYNYPMDEEGVLGKANRNGTILINQNLSPAQAKEVEEHERGHIDQMKRGDLDYDDQNVYWKGKVYPRSKMKEGAHNLPWEKEIYDKTEKKEDMGFKLKGFRGNKSPFDMMINKGLITPLNNNGDDKKNKETSTSSYQTGEIPTGEELKKLQEALNKKAQEEKKDQSQTFNLSTGKNFRERWNEMTDEEKGKYDSFDDWKKKAEAWNKENKESLTITATYKPDVKSDLTQEAKPVKDNIGTELYNKIYAAVRDKYVYDSELGYKRKKTKEEILREGPSELVAQYRNATKAKTDDTVTIGEDFDKETLDIAVTEQIDEKKKAREQNNQ